MLTNHENYKIYPVKSKLAKWKIACGDIETVPNSKNESALLGDFSMGATCIDGTQDSVIFWKKPESMLLYMLSFKRVYRWFFHNGSRFDFRYFLTKDCLEIVKQLGLTWEPINAENPKGIIYRHSKQRYQVTIADSSKLMPAKLRDLCKSFKVPVQKGFIDFEHGEVFNPYNPNHKQYLTDDVVSLHQIMTKYRYTINNSFRCEPKCTASSTAFQAFRVTLNRSLYRHPIEVDDYCRKAYYGGRCQPFYQGIMENVQYIDVNSLYAHIMRNCGTINHPVFVDSYQGTGFYRIEANIPKDTPITVIPCRGRSGNGLIFPTGNFRSYASSVEIDLARELGHKIEIIDGIYFEENDIYTFVDFINKCESLRYEDYKGALGLTAKFTQNNLYGFFGMKPVRDEMRFSDVYPGDDWIPCRLADGSIHNNFWNREIINDSVNIIPAWAAWITANARVYLAREALRQIEYGAILTMCDTDSLAGQGLKLDKVNPVEYGMWKLEHNFDQFINIASKCYAGRAGLDYHLRCKGIPDGLLKYGSFIKRVLGEEIVVKFPQLNSIKTVLKQDSLGRNDYTRIMPGLNSVTNVVSQGYNMPTLPIHL